MKKSTTRATVIIIMMIIAAVGYYAYLSNQTRENRKEAGMTVIQSTLSRDLVNDYPSTPKEVIKYYNEIMKCYYNEEGTEEEIEELGYKARELFDQDLAEYNEVGTYLIRLQAEIQEFKDKERRITSISVANSTSVDRFEEDGYSFARLSCGYNIMESGSNHSQILIYLLRRDENKKWKIYGWESADKVNLKSEAAGE